VTKRAVLIGHFSLCVLTTHTKMVPVRKLLMVYWQV